MVLITRPGPAAPGRFRLAHPIGLLVAGHDRRENGDNLLPGEAGRDELAGWLEGATAILGSSRSVKTATSIPADPLRLCLVCITGGEPVLPCCESRSSLGSDERGLFRDLSFI